MVCVGFLFLPYRKTTRENANAKFGYELASTLTRQKTLAYQKVAERKGVSNMP